MAIDLDSLRRSMPGVAASARRRGGGVQRIAPQRLRVQVIESYPHDPGAFTQGLVLAGGRLFESTGLEGRSSLREVELKTGKVLRKLDVPAPVFAEGLALVGTRLFQITWKHGQVYTYDRDSFKKGATFDYDGEGWGLCYNGQDIVMSDGSARLTFRGPETFRPVRELTVRSGGQPVDQLNELECVGPHVYANVWMTDRIVRIDPKSGEVLAFIDAANLLAAGRALRHRRAERHRPRREQRHVPDHRQALAADVPRQVLFPEAARG